MQLQNKHMSNDFTKMVWLMSDECWKIKVLTLEHEQHQLRIKYERLIFVNKQKLYLR